MLRKLVIDNIALIDHLEIDFSEGLTVLSGETGSGKSIIIDSLSFVLGERADKTLIKYGADAAEVTALFDADQSDVLRKLAQYGYGDDNEILLYRKMSLSGKNEIRIQGKTATLAILKDICAELVDIFGQGEHLALLNEKNQLAVLDAFCHHDKICEELRKTLYPQLSAVNRELKELGGDEAERERLLDILKYQIDEIQSVDPSEQEEEELLIAHKRMVNAERLSAAVGQAVDLLSGETGAISALSMSASALNGISNLDESAAKLSERLVSCRIEAEDVAAELQDMLSALEFSPAEVDKIENRLEKLRQLKRKYGGSIAEVLKFACDAREKFETLSNATEKIAQLNVQKTEILRRMYDLSQQKSAERRKTANELAARIMQELSDLGMRGTNFQVMFNDQPTFEQYCSSPSSDGFDTVEFLMSANAGEPLKSLAKVISGGEMSRFMLAVKNITALAEKIPTMIFDEIDAGISGNMAQMVANKLANVSSGKQEGYQCVVITHLPQIAAMADTNLFIKKTERNGKTFTQAEVLSEKQRTAEVARLMGGVGEHALVNAQELIAWSDRYKSKC